MMITRIRWFVRRTVGGLCNVIEPHFGSYEKFMIDEKNDRIASVILAGIEAGRKGGDVTFRRPAPFQEKTR